MRFVPVRPRARVAAALAAAAICGYSVAPVAAQSGPRVTSTPQKLDDDYTARIKKATPDPRIITELVDHMPASATVPSPLKFFGYVPGEPGTSDLSRRHRQATTRRSRRRRRASSCSGSARREEGRDMVALAIADEATIKQLDKYKEITAKLTDPRKLQEAEAKTADRDRQADLLRDRQHPHAGDRQPRDADRAGVPPRGRGDRRSSRRSATTRSSCSRRRPKWTAARRRWTTSAAA